MMEERFIGLSLSGCIMDIAKGVVKEEEVKFIVAGTCCPTDKIELLLEQYKRLEWVKCYEDAREILMRFLEQGKIVQPRLLGLPYPNIAAGRWAIQGHPEDLRRAIRDEYLDEHLHDNICPAISGGECNCPSAVFTRTR